MDFRPLNKRIIVLSIFASVLGIQNARADEGEVVTKKPVPKTEQSKKNSHQKMLEKHVEVQVERRIINPFPLPFADLRLQQPMSQGFQRPDNDTEDEETVSKLSQAIADRNYVYIIKKDIQDFDVEIVGSKETCTLNGGDMLTLPKTPKEGVKVLRMKVRMAKSCNRGDIIEISVENLKKIVCELNDLEEDTEE